jgi:hypothetical protein
MELKAIDEESIEQSDSRDSMRSSKSKINSINHTEEESKFSNEFDEN